MGADSAVDTARRLGEVRRANRAPIETQGRRAGSTLRVHEALLTRPILSIQDACRLTGLSFPATASGMALLHDLGIVAELTGRRRNQDILNEGMEVP